MYFLFSVPFCISYILQVEFGCTYFQFWSKKKKTVVNELLDIADKTIFYFPRNLNWVQTFYPTRKLVKRQSDWAPFPRNFSLSPTSSNLMPMGQDSIVKQKVNFTRITLPFFPKDFTILLTRNLQLWVLRSKRCDQVLWLSQLFSLPHK